MANRPRKPCATCGHGKSLHATHSCNHRTTKRGQTFRGINAYVVYCPCRGFEPRSAQ